MSSTVRVSKCLQFNHATSSHTLAQIGSYPSHSLQMFGLKFHQSVCQVLCYLATFHPPIIGQLSSRNLVLTFLDSPNVKDSTCRFPQAEGEAAPNQACIHLCLFSFCFTPFLIKKHLSMCCLLQCILGVKGSVEGVCRLTGNSITMNFQ